MLQSFGQRDFTVIYNDKSFVLLLLTLKFYYNVYQFTVLLKHLFEFFFFIFSRYSIVDTESELPYDSEEAALLWINKSCLKLRHSIDEDLGFSSSPSSPDSSHVSKSYFFTCTISQSDGQYGIELSPITVCLLHSVLVIQKERNKSCSLVQLETVNV